jgi:methionine biosynthesis protein MetW
MIIASWIEPGSKVLDLGCGEGNLLYYLKNMKGIVETGIEIVKEKAVKCISKGLSVIQGDINEEILDYPENTFDYVILSQTLQQVYKPSDLIHSLLRIGMKGIVSFPNFSNWRIRLQLLTTGYAPITKQLPYEWFDTPNIRVITIKDFRKFSKKVNFDIAKEVAANSNNGKVGGIVSFMPTLFAEYGIFLIERKQ